MFIVEKIGKLILITMEGILDPNAVEIMKIQLKEITESEVEAVVSINHANIKGGDKVSEIGRAAEEIVNFCKKNGIRVYSYYNK